MIKITIDENTANSPQKQLVKDLIVAFAEADRDAILNTLTDDAEWVIVGGETHSGKDAIKKELETMQWLPTNELLIEDIIVDDNKAVVNGTMTFDNSKAGFSDVCDLSDSSDGLKINKIQAYLVDTGI